MLLLTLGVNSRADKHWDDSLWKQEKKEEICGWEFQRADKTIWMDGVEKKLHSHNLQVLLLSGCLTLCLSLTKEPYYQLWRS